MSRHARRGEQTHGGDAVLVQQDAESSVDVEAGGQHLGAVASNAACPLLPGRGGRTGATPEDVAVDAVLVVCEVGLRVVARAEGAEDAVLAGSPGAEGVRGERRQQRVDWQGGQRKLQRETNRRKSLANVGYNLNYWVKLVCCTTISSTGSSLSSAASAAVSSERVL